MLVTLVALGVIVAVILMRTTLSASFHSSGDQAGAAFRPPLACEAAYSGACVPPAPPNVDCDDLEALGITEVQLVGTDDPDHLDADGDGIGCNES